jgi:hypothetical protein
VKRLAFEDDPAGYGISARWILDRFVRGIVHDGRLPISHDPEGGSL